MSKGRILIIDDEKELLDMLKIRFEHDGYSVECLETGEKALDCARQFKPDLVLLDIMMPDVDGYDVCYQLKHDPDTASAVVILFTAQPQWAKEVKEVGQFASADDYIFKPFEARDLMRKVEYWLKKKSGNP